LGSIRNKSLISAIRENPRGNFPTSKWIQVEHLTTEPYEDIASFIPDVDTPGPRFTKLPFTLNLRLGKAGHAYISLKVDGLIRLRL